MRFWTRWHIAWADRKERKKLYKTYAEMKHVGRNVHLCRNYVISGRENITIGDNVWVGHNCRFQGEGGLIIRSGTLIARDTEIYTRNHNYNSDDLKAIPHDERFVNEPVVIGENVMIGTKVIILPGVTIGEGAVLGAAAVITKDVPPYAVVGGNPAKILKYRNIEKYLELKAAGKIYLDVEYDYDKSSLRKREYLKKK